MPKSLSLSRQRLLLSYVTCRCKAPLNKVTGPPSLLFVSVLSRILLSFETTSRLTPSERKLKLRPRECFSRDTMRRFLWFSVASPLSALSVSETFSFGVDTEWPLSLRGTECPQSGDCEALLRHCRNGLNALSLGERTTLWRPAMHAQLTGQIFLTSERATPQI